MNLKSDLIAQLHKLADEVTKMEKEVEANRKMLSDFREELDTNRDFKNSFIDLCLKHNLKFETVESLLGATPKEMMALTNEAVKRRDEQNARQRAEAVPLTIENVEDALTTAKVEFPLCRPAYTDEDAHSDYEWCDDVERAAHVEGDDYIPELEFERDPVKEEMDAADREHDAELDAEDARFSRQG